MTGYCPRERTTHPGSGGFSCCYLMLGRGDSGRASGWRLVAGGMTLTLTLTLTLGDAALQLLRVFVPSARLMAHSRARGFTARRGWRHRRHPESRRRAREPARRGSRSLLELPLSPPLTTLLALPLLLSLSLSHPQLMNVACSFLGPHFLLATRTDHKFIITLRATCQLNTTAPSIGPCSGTKTRHSRISSR